MNNSAHNLEAEIQDLLELDEDQVKKLSHLEFIHSDISKFIKIIFIEKATLDIHYLEDSLRSSVHQLKQNVLGTEIMDDSELELF